MTTSTDRSQGKTRDRHTGTPSRSTTRPPPIDAGLGLEGSGEASSADEIRETVRQAVGKGVAAVAGAAEGISETMEETNLQETAESAVRQVGQTAHKVVRAAREETDNIRQAFKGDGGPWPQGSEGHGAGGSSGQGSGSGLGAIEGSESSSGLGSGTFGGLGAGSEGSRQSGYGGSGEMPYGSGETRSTLDTSAEDEDESKGI